ncbi:nucleotide sugar dehydrogenase, partial [Brachybacterium sp. GCM10030268]
ESADLVIVQTNHAEYRELSAADVPGIKLIIDGRNITTAENWAGTPRLVLGDGSASTHQQDQDS